MLATAIAIAVVFLSAQFSLAQNVSVSVPTAAPTSAFTLDPALISFSIEQDRWTDWAGIDTPNSFFLNTLNNLAERTGTPPWIRIGANSEDRTDFSYDFEFSEAIFPAPSATMPYPEATNITVGSGYYTLASHLPYGTRVVWGVNLGTDNITAAFLEASAIRAAFNSNQMSARGVRLESVEIGNEPDLYGNNGHRNASTWTVQEYVKEWTTFAKNVSAAAGVSRGGPKFFGLAFSHNAHSGSSSKFSFDNAVAAGLLDSPQGKLIDEISQHMYFGSGVAGIANLPTLMSKALIRSNLSTLSEDIASVQNKGLDFVMGETNSYFSHGAPGVSNAAGAAIWALDYSLLAAAMGVKRMHFHEGVGFRYNMIQPVSLNRSIIDASPLPTPLPPHIQAAYYGALVVTEAVGKSGSSKIVELDIPDDTLSGYAIFEGRKVKRVVVIDSEAFLKGDDMRGARNVTLTFENSNGKGVPRNAVVKRLAIGHADDTSGMTWAGQTFETTSGLPSGEVQVESLSVTNGSVSVRINATEAILLSLS